MDIRQAHFLSVHSSVSTPHTVTDKNNTKRFSRRTVIVKDPKANFEALTLSSEVDLDTWLRRNSRKDVPFLQIDHITEKNNVISSICRQSTVSFKFWSMFVGLSCHHHHNPTFLPSNHSGVQVRTRRTSTSVDSGLGLPSHLRLLSYARVVSYLMSFLKN